MDERQASMHSGTVTSHRQSCWAASRPGLVVAISLPPRSGACAGQPADAAPSVRTAITGT